MTNQVLTFDIETDGFLDVLTRIHCLTVKVHNDFDEGSYYRYRFNADMNNIEKGLKWLQDAPSICGHNVIKFDIPAIQKLYPWFKPKGKVLDTLVMSRLIWTNLKDLDGVAMRKGKIPTFIFGKHSLEAWGYRIGNYKGDYKGHQ